MLGCLFTLEVAEGLKFVCSREETLVSNGADDLRTCVPYGRFPAHERLLVFLCAIFHTEEEVCATRMVECVGQGGRWRERLQARWSDRATINSAGEASTPGEEAQASPPQPKKV